MFEVVYYSGCGNSKTTCKNTIELAQAIAIELGVKAEDIQTGKELLKNSLVFLGCGHSDANLLGVFVGQTRLTTPPVVS